MNKNLIKNFAIWARQALIKSVKTRAELYGISSTECMDEDADSVHGVLLRDVEKRQRRAFMAHVKAVGYEQAIEEVAYTWFNRFCALRFMEVNGLLPSKIRVFTDEHGAFRPQILTEAIYLEDRFENLDIDYICTLKSENKNEDLYRYLLLKQCEALTPLLPMVFRKLEDDIELLCPDNLLLSESVLSRFVQDIPADYFDIQSGTGQIEIIGWLYQYYISEKHEAVVDPLYGKYILKEDIPAATQLFTPDWVVQYIVDNTIGRYWMMHHPESQLGSQLPFYVSSPSTDMEQHPDIKPQDVTVFDPCVGSGHFLMYAMDVLMLIYREYGYSDREAIAEILTHNIYGLDIDARAVQLAYFAVMMKGCQYDRRFLRRGIQPRVYAFTDSSFVTDAFAKYFCASEISLKSDFETLVAVMQHAEERGSMIQVPDLDTSSLWERQKTLENQLDLFQSDALKAFRNILSCVDILSRKYAAVITNPPYMNKYDKSLKLYIQENYKDYSGDLFSIFIYRCIQFCHASGFTGLMTPNVWMFIKSYEKLRRYIIQEHAITTLVQMAKGAFFSEATVDICAFVIQNQSPGQTGVYFRLEDFIGNMDLQCQKLLEGIQDTSCSYRYTVNSELLKALPGCPIGYWATHTMLKAFQQGEPLSLQASPRQGLATTNNQVYLRFWFEVQKETIGFGMSRDAAIKSDIKWFPYNKGGEYRKWYGNQYYIVNYQYNGASIKRDVLTKYPYLKTPDFVVKNQETYFCPCLSWSKISSGRAAFRYFPQGFLYDVSGCSIFFKDQKDLYYYAGFLNSSICSKFLEIISPTLNYETGHIGILPILKSEKTKDVQALVEDNIQMAKEDWDSFENSWHFRKHPLI